MDSIMRVRDDGADRLHVPGDLSVYRLVAPDIKKGPGSIAGASASG